MGEYLVIGCVSVNYDLMSLVVSLHSQVFPGGVGLSMPAGCPANPTSIPVDYLG